MQACYEYSQGEIYFRNEKYEKALNLFNILEATLKFSQAHSEPHIVVKKRVYACLIQMGRIKDGELVLYNLIESISSDIAKKEDRSTPEQRISTKVDLLVHLLTYYYQQELSPNKLLKIVNELLKDPELSLISGAQRAFTHLVIGLCQFITERVPYADMKTHFKFALNHAVNEPMLLSVILHDLAVLNYCELQDHSERVMEGEEEGPLVDNEMLEQVEKSELDKAKKRS